MAEHQLNDADIDAVRQQPTRAFVTLVAPAQVDLFLAIQSGSAFGSRHLCLRHTVSHALSSPLYANALMSGVLVNTRPDEQVPTSCFASRSATHVAKPVL